MLMEMNTIDITPKAKKLTDTLDVEAKELDE
jgi:hypothetical protein